MSKPILTSIGGRRQRIFAAAIATAGFSLITFAFVPVLIISAEPLSLFGDSLQEGFFFDLIGWINGLWLFSWVGSICNWKGVAKLGQWLAIVLLSLAQVILMGIWQELSHYDNLPGSGLWLVPLLWEMYFLGCFLALFTMPALTHSGNRALTGLGTLILLLPWLMGRQSIIMGTQILWACTHH